MRRNFLTLVALSVSLGAAACGDSDDGANHDVYDVSHDEDVVLPDGTVDRPYHRDCAVLVEVTAPDGTVTTGAGHAAILPPGVLPLRGLD